MISLPGNRRIGSDLIAGIFYVVGQDDCENLVSLSPELIETYMTCFWEVET